MSLVRYEGKPICAIPEGYVPSEKESYMCPEHLEYFRQQLEAMRVDLQRESMETVAHLQEVNWNEPDLNDRATVESETALELRTRDRYRKLLAKVAHALDLIAQGEYGWCEETGEEIGLRRLMARPVATLSIEAQERHELYESQHSDDEDELI